MKPSRALKNCWKLLINKPAELNESGLETYRAVAENALPILFQAGYLTIKEYISDVRLYRLGFPIDEVRYGFLENLLPAYIANKWTSVYIC